MALATALGASGHEPADCGRLAAHAQPPSRLAVRVGATLGAEAGAIHVATASLSYTPTGAMRYAWQHCKLGAPVILYKFFSSASIQLACATGAPDTVGQHAGHEPTVKHAAAGRGTRGLARHLLQQSLADWKMELLSGRRPRRRGSPMPTKVAFVTCGPPGRSVKVTPCEAPRRAGQAVRRGSDVRKAPQRMQSAATDAWTAHAPRFFGAGKHGTLPDYTEAAMHETPTETITSPPMQRVTRFTIEAVKMRQSWLARAPDETGLPRWQEEAHADGTPPAAQQGAVVRGYARAGLAPRTCAPQACSPGPGTG